jgi:hypothetical protein
MASSCWVYGWKPLVTLCVLFSTVLQLLSVVLCCAVLRCVALWCSRYNEIHGEVCPAGWHPGAATMKADPTGSKEFFSAGHTDAAH